MTTFDISYGNEEAPYAAAVHERHPTKKKFLEKAIRNQTRGAARRIAAKLSGVLRRVLR